MLLPFLLLSSAICMSASAQKNFPEDFTKEYFNQWAVEVKGGEQVARKVAKELDYTFVEPIEHLDDHYIFVKHDHPQFSTKSAGHHTKSLLDRDEVVWAEQTETIQKSLRSLLP